MTKKEITEMLKQYNDYDDITVITSNREDISNFAFATNLQVKNYKMAERALKHYLEKAEKIFNSTLYKNETNRRKALDKVYSKIEWCYKVMAINEY